LFLVVVVVWIIARGLTLKYSPQPVPLTPTIITKLLEGKNGAQNVASLDGSVSLGESIVTKKEF